MPRETLIKLQDICRDFENDGVVTKVLHHLNFEIKNGEFVAIMGPSGSGKSTLMHILSFLDRVSCGQYYFNSEDTSEFNDDKLAALRNKKIGFVFQSFNLLPRTTVLNNVILPLEYNGAKDKKTAAEAALKAVGLEHRLNYFSNQLSGGEKQRVAIARALVNNPDVIFADEPTGNLDSKSGAQVMEILVKLNEEGKTIILVTHEQYTANAAKRIIKLKDGEIVSDEMVAERTDVKNGLVK
ncbi:macrolide ABC transporter ATP-binding protein [Candidatus Kuenenbacteria bacterium RIFCSPLOWO2_12_FULL_42_13]|uniref:ABC transporter related protein n=4 Tax=Candidatus Kueneniibacteriota TaxID=1752740 RepID=A0A0G0YW79_9BACT|nr:MAG: ABC transporter related protein [Candidatus Kuenenbacteria bacterium GW2011_GWA2_42_15]OGG89688.1 MAG: macrolide ABC transporter ATP-binding protein [Candidatus Kuenenbacteria bacterium RIFCSPHIGHO2_02_FULL_42_29]OGG91453.1 MAG: macrolide ABC transporter ATP-binding protein [Candidatus Kuenenbacteria bacterium RIFCSPLOWO2_02_FULL_42_16]OGG92426.1 MAG: macrolide ABC transporter ATP-binding protein [Candidatus Kuenenbacteria bacterium RIFCSPLOWO2_12_FULL_42_13]OGH00136.1 MAG: macrolide AB